mmetsp:Transcript_1075/g.1361  ORF Transcript_1075/g.1361 Transcript_1075/m.1361 type:complete len:289 (+) Transcript_1075:111-977(+)|eukprot:jgi/Bigna1/91071/estExt_fgenesh1_pg.C_870069
MAESKEITVDQSKIQSLQMERSVTVFQVAPDTSVDLTSSELLLSKIFVEFIAMTLFVFIGCGAAVSTSRTADFGSAGWVTGVALAFGFAITALAYSIGHVSGGHINCAVTLGLVIAGACPVVDGLVIVCGQILGSLFGAGLLAGVFSKKMDATGALGSNAFSPGFGAGNVFIGECLMTFLLFFVVAECALRKRLDFNPKIFMDGVGFNPPIAIGFAVFLAHMVLIPVDGCSINPTRSFGPLVVASMRGLPKGSTHWENFPVFFFAPMIGASIAGLYYRLTKTSRGDNS